MRYLAARFDEDGMAAFKVFTDVKDAKAFVDEPHYEGAEIVEFAGELLSIEEDYNGLVINNDHDARRIFQMIDGVIVSDDTGVSGSSDLAEAQFPGEVE